MHLGVDTGGTFTDLVAYDPERLELSVVKVSSTPHSPADAVVSATSRLGVLDSVKRLTVGSTIAINAILQRRGADVIFITTAGFEDLPHIQRINRRRQYDLQWQKGKALVRRACTIGVRERVDYHGSVIEALDDVEVERVAAAASGLAANLTSPAIAVCLLFAYMNSEHEERLADALATALPAVPISVSFRVAPIWREYDRGSTTIADAYLKPVNVVFTRALESGLRGIGLQAPITLMKSNGGQIPIDTGADHSAELILSGLAGGLLAGKYYSDLLGSPNLITLDMGGTSADVGLVRGGKVFYRDSYDIDWSIPVLGSFVDMTTIGAGGSSLAGFDRGGLLKVGPESAGADPGPASYGKGGTEPTVTDANLVLGRLDPSYFLGGQMPLRDDLARAAIAKIAGRLGSSLEDAALAIVRMANENMVNAVRLLTVDRGLDHREFDLMAFGGAGPLHAASVAGALDLGRIVIPVHPGLTSAFGLLAAKPRVDRRWTRALMADSATSSDLRDAVDRLVGEAMDEIHREGHTGHVVVTRTAKMRYFGQNYEQEIAVPEGEIDDDVIPELVRRFHLRHKAFYGYAMRQATCEIAELVVTAEGVVVPPTLAVVRAMRDLPTFAPRRVFFASEGWVKTPVRHREALLGDDEVEGPAIIQELDSTTLVAPGQRLSVHKLGSLYLDLADEGAALTATEGAVS